MKKWGLALGSGGGRGIAHIGFIKALEEAGLKPDVIAGCSMGSVVGSCYAMGMDADKMYEEIKTFKISKLADLSIVLRHGSLFKTGKMREKLKSYLGETKFGDLKIPFGCVAVDLISGDTVFYYQKNKRVVDYVTASSAIPAIFRPVEIDKKLLVDGGVKCRVPVEEARKLGAEVVVAVDVLGPVRPGKEKYGVVSLVTRLVDITDAELAKYKKLQDNADLYIEPDMQDISQYNLKGTEIAYNAGYECGKDAVEKIKTLIK